VDLKQLTALVTVAEVGSVTRAARILHVVQPAVTRQIRLLEDEIGLPLFERTRQGMVPTEAGARLVDRARRALAELERARAEITPRDSGITGIVSVGVLESSMDLVVDSLIDAVGKNFPGIQMRVLTAYSGYLQQWLDDGGLDMSLLYNLSDSASLAVTPLLEERLWAVAPPDAGLRPNRPVAFEDVLAQPLVLPVPGHGLRVLIDQGMAEMPTAPRISVETNSMHLQKRAVLAGVGWTILPAAGVADDAQAGRLSGAPLTRPSVQRSVVLGLQRAPRRTPAVEAVAKTLIDVVADEVRHGRWPATRRRRSP
jgi:DNA-binding transcriptional LysR family regulator